VPNMKTHTSALLTAITVIALASGLVVTAQTRRGDGASINMNGDGPITRCADLNVKFGRRPAITEETETPLAASQVSTLRARLSKGGIFITGWDQKDYSVKTCKAVADDDPNPTSTFRDIVTTTNGGELGVSGPTDREWTANLIVSVPRLSMMEIETSNGPLALRDLAGNIHVTAVNGPISLKNVGGIVQATTTNGPIAIAGASGDQRVSATNGPVSIQLSGNRWDGPGLEVTTKNGPLSLGVPDAYGSGIVIQMSDRSPINCSVPACAGANRTLGSPSTIRLGTGDPVVRLSTGNGPLSVQQAKN
jgi:hypothetical protein